MKTRKQTPLATLIQQQFIVCFVAAASVLIPRPARAQVLTGALVGTVRDAQGAVVPGAIVRTASAMLIGGPATTTTNDRGQWRFPVLPPGPYVLDIGLSGFAPYHEEDIHIGVGATLERTVVLQLAGVAESIVVQGSGSRLEARGSGFETQFGPEYLQTIPTRRFSMFDLIREAPGVSPTSPTSGTVNTVSTFGSGGNENLFLIDGTNFTCPCAGVSRAEPSVDVIQEVQVQSVGASAEYGNIQGGVFNVVTRQGSNRFAYDTSYYGQASRLTSQPVLLPVSGSSGPPRGYERVRYRDFTTDLGGPVIRDRLWFFTGYQYLRDYDSQPGTDPAFPRTYEQDKIFAKLTWQLTPALHLDQSFHEEFWLNPDRPTFVMPFETTLRRHAHVPATTFAHLTHTLSSSSLWDVRVGRFVYSRKDDPSTGNLAVPNRFDRVTGLNSGAPPQFGGVTLIRTMAKATFSHYQRGLLAADHEWKVGTQIEKGEHYGSQVIPTGVRFVDSSGQPFQAVSRDPAISGGQFITAALFATDALSFGERVTINAGVRFDHSRAISQDLHAVDAQGHETGNIVPGLGTLYTWNVVSPRLGLTAKLGDGRTILRASYGRFYQGPLTGEYSTIHSGVTPTTTTAFDPTTGDYTRLVSVVDPKINLQVDPDTRAPQTDEYSIGVDREICARLAMAVAYIRKSGSDYIGWTDVGGVYRTETRPLPDGRSVPVFVLVNSTADRRFLATNPDGYSMTYNGLVIAAEKRRSNGWQVFGSYTLSRADGLQASSGTTAGGAQLSSMAGEPPFGRDPNDLTNAHGRLANDRPHIFRVMGTADVGRTGFMVAASLQYFSGKPWAASTQIVLPQGDQRVLLEPRGSRRLSSQSLLDVRVSRTIRTGRWGRFELLADLLNVLNDSAKEELASDNLYSPNFGQSTVFIDPRRAMLGVRWNLGP
jgi:hypothetical protein